jgi:PhoPQ-activated pathogenicity-related protein
VNKPDPNYKWSDTSVRVPTILGGSGHLLNVTSQQWLDESRAYGPDGALWTHQVLTIVPRHLKVKNKAVIYITGGCNENPGVPSATDEEPLAMDAISAQTGAIGVVLNQIPNCHMHYPSDPSGRGRSEDSMIAWAWHQFLETGDPEWLPRLPMVKAAMKAMQAVQEYTKEAGIADIDGWLVAGASKRGWTTWMVGAVNCPTCPNIDAIAPIVPIVPNLRAGVHHMWEAYGGFTFAFNDYTDVNLTTLIDDEKTINLFKIVDPIHYITRLERLPKSVLVSGGDEFMMFEWTRLWWDKFTGEKHLYIADNAEHSYATGIVGLLRTLGNFANSVYLGGTRPSFDWDLDLENGEINVRIPEGQPHGKVVLRHSHTLSLKRRDFRLAIKADEVDGKPTCKLPLIGPISMDGSDICGQPVIWVGETLNETSPGFYNVKVPRPELGLGWVGAYVEVYFPSDTGLFDEYQFTTTGMVWPQRMPFEPCVADGCKPNLV